MKFNMKKIVKRIAAMGAAVMMMSSMAIGASAYTLRFTSGAPSKDNIMTATTTVKATSAGKITVKSTTFAVSVSGAYTQMKCTSHKTNESNVNSVGTYYMNYKGTAVPKVGTPVTVKATLKNYVVSKTVSSKGTITA